jgi:hypothetical protein
VLTFMVFAWSGMFSIPGFVTAFRSPGLVG